MRRHAFTLLELLLVLAIVIMISAIGIAGYQRQYARAQFKAGVIQLQVDIACARLMAMQSGNAYVFRYAPGTGVYEIAPLKTLQEALYRMNGDLGSDDGYDALGGSLSSVGGADFAYGSSGLAPMLSADSLGLNPLGYDSASAVSGMTLDPTLAASSASVLGTQSGAGAIPGAFGLPGSTPAYDDDLFSPANIAADMADAMKAFARNARAGSSNVDLTSGLGGSLNSTPGVSNNLSGSTLGGSTLSGSALGGSTLGGSTLGGSTLGGSTLGGSTLGGSTLGGSTLGGSALGGSAYGTDPAGAFGYGADYSGIGGEFAVGTDMTAASPYTQTSIRSLEGAEKRLADENTLCSRVNLDGAIVRKQIAGHVLFTFMRVSESTSAPLRLRRPGGVKNDKTSLITGQDEGEDLGSSLGGSLHSIPSGTTGEGLGGGLNSIAGTDAANPFGDAAALEEDPLARSCWSEPLVFFSNGKTSSAVIGFVSNDEYEFYSEIALRGMTGVARISAISSIPPDMDPSLTALTQEQLFRLRNPGVAYSGNNADAAAIQGGALGGSAVSQAASGTSAGAASATSGIDPLGAGNVGAADALGNVQAPAVNYGTPGGGYGSTERRSGYRFDANNNANAAAPGLGVDNASNLNAGTNFNANMDPNANFSVNPAAPNLGNSADLQTNAFNAIDAAASEGALGGSDSGVSGGALGGSDAGVSGGALGGDSDSQDEKKQESLGGGM